MEHNRPNGLAQGYYCLKCGQPTGMYGHNDCKADPELVKTLEELNKKDSVENQ